jgi:hypothetical protein
MLAAALGAAMIVGAFAVDSPSYAAGKQQGADNGDQLQVRDRLKDGSCTDSVVSAIFEADMDQDKDRLRDGSCGDCDGDPDVTRDRDRVRLGW